MSVYKDLKRANGFSSTVGRRGFLHTPPREHNSLEILDRSSDIASDLRYKEHIERFEAGELGEYIYFEPPNCSPYEPSLDGQVYRTQIDFGPTGMCPLCNNAEARELDEFYLENLYRPSAWKKYPFSRELVIRHIVQHVAPIYLKAASERGCVWAREAIAKGGSKQYTSNDAGTPINAMRTEVSREMYRALAAMRDEVLSRVGEERATIEIPPEVIGVPLDPDPREYRGRPEGERAKDWYAFEGGFQVGALRPWGDRRVSTEIAQRKNDGLVLLDEMLDVREMSRRIYSEIMDSDIDLANEEEEQRAEAQGRKPKYIERNYSAAVAAVREIKSVVLEMSKLALIASRVGDDKDHARKLSPTMQGLLDDILVGKRDSIDADVTILGSGLGNDDSDDADE